MRNILLATVAILAFTAPSFAAEPAKTGDQTPPSSAAPSFYLAQDTETMKCQIVDAEPAADSGLKVVGTSYSTEELAETAMAANKTCLRQFK
jgi:hypothetical protein